MLKVTVSGEYRTSNGKEGDIVEFENVVGIMPDCNEDWVLSHVKNRYLARWIKADARYKQRMNSVRTLYIDNIEVVKGVASCYGKDIKAMTWEELQDLAVCKHLLAIPLINATDIRQARETAYFEYSDKIVGNKIDIRKDYSYINLPELKVKGAEVYVEEPKVSNEDAIKDLQEETHEFTRDELKKLATDKGCKFPANIKYERLYEMVFGK